MHRTTQTTRNDFILMPPFVADNAGLYAIVAEAIARQPDHLGELVELMTAIQRAGVDIVDLWDCLTAELVLREMQ